MARLGHLCATSLTMVLWLFQFPLLSLCVNAGYKRYYCFQQQGGVTQRFDRGVTAAQSEKIRPSRSINA